MLPNYNIVELGERASVYARAFGRKMIALIAGSRIENNKLYRLLEDGTELIATRAHKQYRLTITTPLATAPSQLDTVCNLWIPHGFVVYPSSSSSTGGWGAPVAGAIGTIFVAANTAPGLDVARWTAAGNLGEVLLTKDVGAGYPPLWIGCIPILFSAKEAPGTLLIESGTQTIRRTLNKKYKQPKQATWAAYRMEFDGFRSKTGRGGTARQALFSSLNSGQQYNLPIRGYYDPTVRDVDFATSSDFGGFLPWLTDGDIAGAPAGYVHALDRKNKDGIVDTASIDTITNAGDSAAIIANLESEAQLVGGHFTQPRTSLSLGIAKGLHALTAMERQQWIAYGVRYWVPTDPSQPILSWDGYTSWNWHIDLILGVPLGPTFQDLDWYVHVVRGATTKIFSKRVCANGRVIGTLPAFVISAGLQSRTVAATDTVPAHIVDRIIVLTWQLSDQDDSSGDFNRVLRVWFLDVTRRNNVPLALPAAAVGAYDATTNPAGWHYASTLQMWASDPGNFLGFLQPPVFSPDGKRVAAVIAAFDSSQTLIATGVAETVFNTIDDGVLDVTTAALDHGGSVWTMDRMNHADPNAKFPFGVDYQADSFNLRAMYYAQDGVFADGFPMMRWSGDPSQIGPTIGGNDLPLRFDDDDDFTTAALYVQDPLTGAMFLVDQHVDSPTTTGPPFQFRFRSVRNASAPATNIFPDAAATALLSNEVLTFANGSNVLACFARNPAGDYIAGYEMCPSGVTEGSHFDTNLGDLAALTQTPGDQLCLYPIGAV